MIERGVFRVMGRIPSLRTAGLLEAAAGKDPDEPEERGAEDGGTPAAQEAARRGLNAPPRGTGSPPVSAGPSAAAEDDEVSNATYGTLIGGHELVSGGIEAARELTPRRTGPTRDPRGGSRRSDVGGA